MALEETPLQLRFVIEKMSKFKITVGPRVRVTVMDGVMGTRVKTTIRTPERIRVRVRIWFVNV